MASFIGLPTEILQQIIAQLYMLGQDVETDEDYELPQSWAFGMETYNINKILTNSFTSDVHRFTDIATDFPLCDICASKQNLVSLARTNRQFASLIVPLLFRLVELKRTNNLASDEVGPVQRFLMALVRNPALGTHVRALSLSAPFERDVDLWTNKYRPNRLSIERLQRGPNPFQDIVQHVTFAGDGFSRWLHDYFTAIPLSTHYSKLFEFLPNLRSLKMAVFCAQDENNNCSQEVAQVFRSPHLQNISELSLFGPCDQFGALNYLDTRTLLLVTKLCNLRTLHLTSLWTRGDSSAVNDGYEVGYSAVSELILDGEVWYQDEILASFVRCFKSLERVRFTSPDKRRDPSLELCLYSQRKSLKSVMIRGGEREGRSYEEEGWSMFKDFPQLEQLGLPIRNLQRLSSGVKVELPKKLKKLRLFIYDKGHDRKAHKWIVFVEKLFEDKRYNLHVLEELDVELCLDFELLKSEEGGGVIDEAYRVLDGLQDMVDGLVTTGNDVGIKFTVSMDKWSVPPDEEREIDEDDG
jgi:hypothetical protein